MVYAAHVAGVLVACCLTATALGPCALVSTVDGAGLTVAHAVDGATLRLLSWLVLPLVPALIAFQAMLWWSFRGRLDGRAPLYR